MYEIDFREVVSLNIKILSFFGVIPPKMNSNTAFLVHWATVVILTGLLYGGLNLAQIVNLVLSFNGDIQEMVTATYITLTNVFSFIKVWFVFRHRERILTLINSLNREEFRPRNVHQRQILADYIKMAKIVTRSLLTISLSTVTFWGVYPLTIKDGPIMPLAAYIPYNIDKSPLFEITYTGEMIGIVVSAFCCLTADSLIAGLTMVICAQLTLLNDSLVNLREYSDSEINLNSCSGSNKIVTLDNLMIKNLVRCVKQHLCILRFAKELESIFTVATFGQFAVSVIILCTTLFKLSTVEKLDLEFVSLVLYQLCMLMEIFVLCYFGNEVIVQYHKLTNSAYQCNWLETSKTFKKDLIFFMSISQKNLRLLAGGYITLSVETFAKILKSSVSYYTVLNQINDN